MVLPCPFFPFLFPLVFSSLGDDSPVRSLSLCWDFFSTPGENGKYFLYIYFNLPPSVLELCRSFAQHVWPSLIWSLFVPDFQLFVQDYILYSVTCLCRVKLLCGKCSLNFPIFSLWVPTPHFTKILCIFTKYLKLRTLSITVKFFLEGWMWQCANVFCQEISFQFLVPVGVLSYWCTV